MGENQTTMPIQENTESHASTQMTPADKEKLVSDAVKQIATWDKEMIMYFMKMMTTYLKDDEKMEIKQSLKRTRSKSVESSTNSVNLSLPDSQIMNDDISAVDEVMVHTADAVDQNSLYYNFPKLPPNKKTKKSITQTKSQIRNPSKGKQIVKPPPQDVKTQHTAQPNQQNQQPETGKPKQINKIPPIILLEKKYYNDVIAIAKQHEINIKHIKNTNKGLEIHVEQADDHRKLTNVLNYNKQEHFTFLLPEEKTLKVVIRGIPEVIEINQVEQDLADIGFQPLKINRMVKNVIDQTTNTKAKIPMPLILIQLEKTEANKEIYNVNKLGFLTVKMEPLNIKKSIRQCHKCQDFGHTESRCFCAPRCHKCAGQHYWKECTKPKDTIPACANCGGPHPANYRGCPQFPKPKSAPMQQPRLIENPRFTRSNVSYAATVSQTNQKTPESNNDELLNIAKSLMETTKLLTHLINTKLNGQPNV